MGEPLMDILNWVDEETHIISSLGLDMVSGL